MCQSQVILFWCLSLFQKSEEPRFSHPTSLPQHLPSQQLMSKDQDEQEELDFLFDEEMEQMDGRKNTFTAWSDEDSDYEIDDRDVNKILIVTQTPPYMRRHPGGDRTGNHTSRAKMSAELAKVINDGLFYYEQDLWTEKFEPEYSQIKVRLKHSFGQGPEVLVTWRRGRLIGHVTLGRYLHYSLLSLCMRGRLMIATVTRRNMYVYSVNIEVTNCPS